jgi:hypothetical protein
MIEANQVQLSELLTIIKPNHNVKDKPKKITM